MTTLHKQEHHLFTVTNFPGYDRKKDEQVTIAPVLPLPYRQTLAHAGELCAGCGACRAVCDEAALDIRIEAGRPAWRWTGACSLCGRCIGACPNGALRVQPFYGETVRSGILHTCEVRTCCRCGRVFALSVMGAALERLGIRPPTGANWLAKLCDGCRAREIAARLNNGITG